MKPKIGFPGKQRLDYLDFEVEIGVGIGREYPIFVRSPAGDMQETMHFPFDELALENRIDKLKIALLRSGGQHRLSLSPEEEAVQTFGSELFNALLSGEARSQFDVSRRDAIRQGKGIRVKMTVQPPELAALPWEFLFDPRQAEYLCLSRITPVVRYLKIPQPIQPLRVELPLRILGMIASPQDLEPLDVENEKRRVEKAVRSLQDRDVLTMSWVEGQTWRDLQRTMRTDPWHIFHFIGHGGFDIRTDEGLIALSQENGRSQFLSATQLGRLLADQASLRLVLLNSCEGAKGSEYDVFSSTASILVRRGIPAVLAMQFEITDQAAVEFARNFYEVIAEGLPVDSAVSEARKAMSIAATNSLEWGTPVLYMRTPDGNLFDIEQTSIHRTKISTLPTNVQLPSSRKESPTRPKQVASIDRPDTSLAEAGPHDESESVQGSPHVFITTDAGLEIRIEDFNIRRPGCNKNSVDYVGRDITGMPVASGIDISWDYVKEVVIKDPDKQSKTPVDITLCDETIVSDHLGWKCSHVTVEGSSDFGFFSNRLKNIRSIKFGETGTKIQMPSSLPDADKNMYATVVSRDGISSTVSDVSFFYHVCKPYRPAHYGPESPAKLIQKSEKAVQLVSAPFIDLGKVNMFGFYDPDNPNNVSIETLDGRVITDEFQSLSKWRVLGSSILGEFDLHLSSTREIEFHHPARVELAEHPLSSNDWPLSVVTNRKGESFEIADLQFSGSAGRTIALPSGLRVNLEVLREIRIEPAPETHNLLVTLITLSGQTLTENLSAYDNRISGNTIYGKFEVSIEHIAQVVFQV